MSSSNTPKENNANALHLSVGDTIICCVHDRGQVEATITSISESGTHDEDWTIDTNLGMMVDDQFTLLTSINTDNIPQGGIRTSLSEVNPQIGSADVDNPRMRALAKIMSGVMPPNHVLDRLHAPPTRLECKQERELERKHRRSMERTQEIAKEIAKLDQPSTPEAPFRSWRDDIDADEDCANKPSDNNHSQAYDLGSSFDDSDDDDNTSMSHVVAAAFTSSPASSSVGGLTTAKSFDGSMDQGLMQPTVDEAKKDEANKDEEPATTLGSSITFPPAEEGAPRGDDMEMKDAEEVVTTAETAKGDVEMEDAPKAALNELDKFTCVIKLTDAHPSGCKLKAEDANLYLDQVKLEFGGPRPHIYNELLETLKNFKEQKVDIFNVINVVRTLFHGYNDLILGFNTFLIPYGYKIEVRDLEPVFVDGSHGTSPVHRDEDLSDFLEKVKSKCNDTTAIQFHKLVDDERFGKDDRYYEHVVKRVLTLFNDFPDLILEFNKFLPDGRRIDKADIGKNFKQREAERMAKRRQRDINHWKCVEDELNAGFLPFQPTVVEFLNGFGGVGSVSWDGGLSNKLSVNNLPWKKGTLMSRSGTISLTGGRRRSRETLTDAVVIQLNDGTKTAVEASKIRIKSEQVVTICTDIQKSGTLGHPLTGPILGADGTKNVLIRWESKREELVWVEARYVQSKWSFEHGWIAPKTRSKSVPQRFGATDDCSLEARSRGGEAPSGPTKDVIGAITKLVTGAEKQIEDCPGTCITVALGTSLQANRSGIRYNLGHVIEAASLSLTWNTFRGKLSGSCKGLDEVLQSSARGDYVSQIAQLGQGTSFEHETMQALVCGGSKGLVVVDLVCGGSKGVVVVEVDKMQKKPAEQEGKTCKEGSASKEKKGASKKKKWCRKGCGNQARRQGGYCNPCFNDLTAGVKSLCFCSRPAREQGGRCPNCIKFGFFAPCKICSKNRGKHKGGICSQCYKKKNYWGSVE
jgi:hypothetical protein